MAQWLNAELVIPENDAPNREYFEQQSGDVLKLPKCTGCNMLAFPPRPMCPDCRGSEFEYEAVSGKGTIHSYFLLSQPINPAFHPYPDAPVALIELDDQNGVAGAGDHSVQAGEHRALRLVGNIVKADGSFEDAENVAVNKRVQVKIIDLGDGMGLPQWQLSDEPSVGPEWQVPGD